MSSYALHNAQKKRAYTVIHVLVGEKMLAQRMFNVRREEEKEQVLHAVLSIWFPPPPSMLLFCICIYDICQ